MTWSVFTPSASPSKLRSTRWRSAGSATARTSSMRRGEAALEERADLRGEEDRLRAARRGAEAHEALARSRARPAPSGASPEHDAHRVVLHVPRDRHLAHERLHLEDVVAMRAPAARSARASPVVRSRIAWSSSRFGKRHVELEEEAIELRFGQRVGALHLERVLRREHEERLVERVASACRR